MKSSQPSPEVVKFAASIWRLCDVLRDDGITYHQYINELSYLLFLKMAEQTGAEESLPPTCRWGTLRSAPGEDQFDVYRRMLVELGVSGSSVIRRIFANPTSLLRQPRSLRLLVEGIEALDWATATRETLGDTYETLLKYSAEKRSGAGQYFTPRPLVECLVHLIDPQPGTSVQDPALGTGGFLVAVRQHLVQSHGSGERSAAKYYGIELVPDNYRLAMMNAFVHGMDAELILGDTLSPAGEELPQADVVLTNPPFGTRRGAGGPRRADLVHSTSNKQLAFLEHVLRTLAAGGKAAVVVPDNVLFEEGPGTAIRRELIETCDVHTILRLPTGIFYAGGVKTNVLFFDARHEDVESGTSSVWVYDMRTNTSPFGRRNPLTREHFKEFEDCYQSDRASEGSAQERWRAFSRQDIERRNYNLDIIWLASNSTRRAEDIPEPEDVIRTAVGRLQVVLDELADLADSLDEREYKDA